MEYHDRQYSDCSQAIYVGPILRMGKVLNRLRNGVFGE